MYEDLTNSSKGERGTVRRIRPLKNQWVISGCGIDRPHQSRRRGSCIINAIKSRTKIPGKLFTSANVNDVWIRWSEGNCADRLRAKGRRPVCGLRLHGVHQ